MLALDPELGETPLYLAGAFLERALDPLNAFGDRIGDRFVTLLCVEVLIAQLELRRRLSIFVLRGHQGSVLRSQHALPARQIGSVQPTLEPPRERAEEQNRKQYRGPVPLNVGRELGRHGVFLCLRLMELHLEARDRSFSRTRFSVGTLLFAEQTLALGPQLGGFLGESVRYAQHLSDLEPVRISDLVQSCELFSRNRESSRHVVQRFAGPKRIREVPLFGFAVSSWGR